MAPAEGKKWLVSRSSEICISLTSSHQQTSSSKGSTGNESPPCRRLCDAPVTTEARRGASLRRNERDGNERNVRCYSDASPRQNRYRRFLCTRLILVMERPLEALLLLLQVKGDGIRIRLVDKVDAREVRSA